MYHHNLPAQYFIPLIKLFFAIISTVCVGAIIWRFASPLIVWFSLSNLSKFRQSAFGWMNRREPIENEIARIVGKRILEQQDLLGRRRLLKETLVLTSYGAPCMVQFLTKSDKYFEMQVDYEDYSTYNMNDIGMLSHQGNCFISFNKNVSQ
jgi:hypothetical protein